jgi:integrase/recombinase XerC
MSAPSFPASWERYRFHLQAERHRRDATIRLYRWVLYRWHWHLGARPWWKATPRHLAAFADPARFSPSTCANYISIIRGFYAFAYAERLIARDPMAGVHLPKRRPPVPKALPVADVRIIQTAADADDRDRVMVALAYFCGMRAGELARAAVEDVHLDDQPRILIPEGKGGRSRVVPLHPACARTLAGYLARRPGTGPLLENRLHPGVPLQPSSVSAMLWRQIHALGINGSAHSLRHSAATEMLRAGQGRNLEEVREFLGHTDSATTRRYVAAYDFNVAAAVAAMPDPQGAVHA